MISVRPFKAADLDAVVPLFDAYRQFNGKPSAEREARAFLEARLANGETQLFVAQEQGGGLVGFTQLFATFSSVSLGAVYIVNDLYVDPKWHRQGIGSALLKAAAEFARGKGAVRLTVTTAIDNQPPQTVVESVGFVRDASYCVYHMRLPNPSTRQTG